MTALRTCSQLTNHRALFRWQDWSLTVQSICPECVCYTHLCRLASFYPSVLSKYQNIIEAVNIATTIFISMFVVVIQIPKLIIKNKKISKISNQTLVKWDVLT